MRLTESAYSFIIEDFFGPGVIAGFTKPALSGHLPQDVQTALCDRAVSAPVAYLKQIHSSAIQVIEQDGMYVGDGLFTSCAHLALVVKTADCLPILLYSQDLGAAGVVHMGWRSACLGILDTIPFELGSFKAVAGVGLRECCFRVTEEFFNYLQFIPFLMRSGNGLFFDAAGFARSRLVKHGLKRENFFDNRICSYCNPGGFFSHRRGDTSSRTLSFIMKS
ncbi:MAG: polyphenol oxidase family protein [Candidatus Omnitrophota bacterium]|nr:polyphenol oxidase family protein [Candidatus Omnitrophota bacterium]